MIIINRTVYLREPAGFRCRRAALRAISLELPTSGKSATTKTQDNENASTRGQKKASCGAAKRVLLLLLFTCEGHVAEVLFDVVRRHALVRERDRGQGAAGRVQRAARRKLQQILLRFRFHVARAPLVYLPKDNADVLARVFLSPSLSRFCVAPCAFVGANRHVRLLLLLRMEQCSNDYYLAVLFFAILTLCVFVEFLTNLLAD